MSAVMIWQPLGAGGRVFIDLPPTRSAFEAVVEEDEKRFGQVELRIHLVPILVQCPDCGQTSEVHNYRFVCAECQKPCANVVQGNELLIERVEMRD